jgi:hypothetical protein
MTSRRPLLFLPLAAPAASPAEILAERQIDYGFQYYDEGSERIQVESHYVRGRIDLDDATSFRFQWLNDAISGASPTGALPGGVQPFLAELDDVRTGLLGAVSRKFGDHLLELEVSRSSESDYFSRGVALKDVWDLNERNTTLTFGINYLDDLVAVPGQDSRTKHSYEFLAGITQILDKNSLVSASITLGTAEGYLNDPYKSIQRTDIISIPDDDGGTTDFPVVNLYPENRPDARFRQVLNLGGRHYFEKLHAALDGTYRYSHDDFGINSHTVLIEWRQEIGSRLDVIPYFRYYRQNEADFFMNTLDGVPIANPPTMPDGSAPNYSADYRLSNFDAISAGLKLSWRINDTFTASAAYEYYDMSGKGGPSSSPAAAYPEADIWTFGVTAAF